MKVKRRAKEIINQMLWEESPFEDAAAICNHDGSKMTTNKAKFKTALKSYFATSEQPSYHTTSDNPIISIKEKEWLSDFQINNCVSTIQLQFSDTTNYSIMYPLPTTILLEILNTNSRIFDKVCNNSHHCIIPLNVGAHWVAMLLDGSSKSIYYIDSFGNCANHVIITSLNQRFHGWRFEYSNIKLQFDSFQCGIWCCFFISVFLDYIKNKNSNNIDFMSFFQIALQLRKLCGVHAQKENINNTFIAKLRSKLSEKITSCKISADITQAPATPQQISVPHVKPNQTLFYQDKFPHHVKLEVVSVDSQHTLWNSPGVKSGTEYIRFIGARFFNHYFLTLDASTVYWNYDLYSIVKSSVPKSLEQEKRDKKSEDKLQFCESRLLNEENKIITDSTIIQDWSQVTSDRKKRNNIAKYVGSNCIHYKLPAMKKLIVNSEAVKADQKVIPQVYTNVDNQVIRTNAYERANRYGEGEGAAVAHIARDHPNDNCLIISNDSDAILYSLLAALQRNRVDGKYKSELWLEIVFTQRKTGICGTSNNRVSEFWNINELIYAIETELATLDNAVYSIVVLYLSAGSDFIEKWYSKTHETFLKAFMKHVKFIGSLITANDITNLDASSYRRLIHTVWCGNSEPEKVSFSKVRENTKKRKNVRLHLPDEHILYQHFKRVSGVFKYMLTYVIDHCINIEWSKYGFEFNSETQMFYPSIFIKEIHKKTQEKKAVISPFKLIKSDTHKNKCKIKSETQIKLLNVAYEKDQHVQTGEELDRLIQTTGLSKKQIQDWFSKKRKKCVHDKENCPPSKKLKLMK